MAHKDKETRNAADRRRYAVKHAQEPTKPLRKSRRKAPGQTPFTSFIAVENVWLGREPAKGVRFFDLRVGGFRIHGVRYNAIKGSVQMPKYGGKQPATIIQGFTPILRRLIIQALERHDGQYFPAEYQFLPKPRRPRQPQSVAA